MEAVPRRATKWMLSNYDTHASVTSMLNDLGLECVEDRRRNGRLTLMYKVLNGHVGISPEDINLTFSSTLTRAAQCAHNINEASPHSTATGLPLVPFLSGTFYLPL